MLSKYNDALSKEEFMSLVKSYEIFDRTCKRLGVSVNDEEVELECIDAICKVLASSKSSLNDLSSSFSFVWGYKCC